ncbi:hypothetical protein ACJX0J_029238, partial [Zea mays]
TVLGKMLPNFFKKFEFGPIFPIFPIYRRGGLRLYLVVIHALVGRKLGLDCDRRGYYYIFTCVMTKGGD